LSGAAASGGGATGASFCAASLSGRPIRGEPGGSGAAAGAAAGGLAGCCAAAPYVKIPKRAPASSRLRGAVEQILIMFSPVWKPFDPCAGKHMPMPVAFMSTVLNIFPSARNRKHL
jgi:hypothetical protein